MPSLSLAEIRSSHPPPPPAATGVAAGGAPQLYLVASSWLRCWKADFSSRAKASAKGTGAVGAGAVGAGAGAVGAGAGAVGAGGGGGVGGPPSAASLLCEHGKLKVPPPVTARIRGCNRT